MKQRIFTAALIVAVMIAVLSLSWTVVYPIAMSLLALVATYEVLRVFELHKRLFVAIAAYVVAIGLPLCAYFMKDTPYEFIQIMSLTFFGFMMYLFVVAVCERGRMRFSEFSSAFAMVIYVVVAFSSLSIIRYFDNSGLFCLGLIFVIAWLTDVFAYIIGSLFGKHKLIPEISPKKTVEGSVGGVVFSTLFAVLYAFVISLIQPHVTPNYLVIAISAPILSVVSQIGDLFASVIKREHNVKDYGNILPGHGGIMDRFDSILAVATATMVICLICPPFV